MARPADASGAQVARLRGFEPPTSGSGEQGNDLTVMRILDSTISVNEIQRSGVDPSVRDLNGFERTTITFLSQPAVRKL
jgi:hypothetical protein